MRDRISVTGSAQPRINPVGEGQPSIDASQVAAALGAEPAEGTIQGQPGPVTLFALRSELLRQRHNGGRSGKDNSGQGLKVLQNEQDRTELEGLAVHLAEAGFTPSPGQIASVLLHAAIQSVKQPAGEKPYEGKLIEAIARQLIATGAVG